MPTPNRQVQLPIETERLTLRHSLETDLDATFAFQGSDEITRFVSYSTRTRDKVREVLEQRTSFRAIEKDGDQIVLTVVERETGAVIGDMHFWVTSVEHKQAEFGYIFHPDFSGKGYATEASRAVLDTLFNVYAIQRVIAEGDVRNAASYRLMERLGMRREAHFVENAWFKGEWSSSYIYA
ncbi:MAG: GNAT family N-acetyltransferase, partial [Thermomicrobiales bacterium]